MSKPTNKHLKDGRKIVYEGRNHTLKRCECRRSDDPKSQYFDEIEYYYRIVRDDGYIIGAISLYVNEERLNSLLYRWYHPDHISEFSFMGRIRENTTSLYITIPLDYIQKYNIMIDDDIKFRINNGRTVFYHISKIGKNLGIVLGRVKRLERDDFLNSNIQPGDYVKIDVFPHKPDYGYIRYDLTTCHETSKKDLLKCPEE